MSLILNILLFVLKGQEREDTIFNRYNEFRRLLEACLWSQVETGVQSRRKAKAIP
jgi:hypothetical protein